MDHPLNPVFGEQGLVFLGIAAVPDAESFADQRQRYHQWLGEHRHGTMAFLERHEAGKYDPEALLIGTRSVMVAALPYHQVRPEPKEATGQIARYAWGRDYHKVLLSKLKRVEQQLAASSPADRWRCFTDTAPLDERHWAALTGSTFVAKNTLAINHNLGSWFLLGEILTTQAMEPTGPGRHASCPSGCSRCRQACPTGALDAEGRMDARKCLAYLTIEHEGIIEDALKPKIGNWLFGCDLCQEVCPFNLRVQTTTEAEFLTWKAGPELSLAPLLILDATNFTRRFAGSPVHRAGRNGLVRNASLVAANTGQTGLLPLLEPLLTDGDAGVADAAKWAVSRLQRDIR